MLLLVFCALGISAVWAQKAFSGKVLGPDGLGLPGVNVVEKSNPTNGVATDIDGNWTLTVPDGNSVLQFSAIGMKMVELKASDAAQFTMKNDAQLLGDVIVTGYASKAKDELSSAISTVTAEQLEGLNPTTSVDNMLQGKAAGVEATALNGKPGTTATVKVRGAVSLNTKGGDKSQPLYVIDGIFVDNEDLAALNPNDISTMSVLKDASAAAIYGSRGANGVVVITTKTGRLNQKAKISFSAKVGYGEKIDDPYDMMNAEQKIQYEREIGIKNWTKDEANAAIALDHNWQDDILKKSKIQSYNLSVRGGSEKSTYYLSLGLDKNTGIIEHLDGYKRISGRTNYSTNLTKKLKATTSVSMAYATSKEPRDRNNVQNPFRAMYDYNPFIPVYKRDAKGNIILDENGNPVFHLTRQGFPILEALIHNPEEDRNFRLLGSFDLDYEIFDWLNFKTKYSATYDRYQREVYTEPGSILDGYVGDKNARGSKTDNGSDTFEYTWLNQFSFNKEFGDHKVDGTLFTEFYKGNHYRYGIGSKGYASPDLTTQDNSSKATSASTTRAKWAMFSIATAANYSYLGKYLVSASLRRDGASRFGEDKKYGIFWSGSLAWNVAKEEFFKAEFVDDLKARISYGTLGSWDIPNYASKGYYAFGSYNDQPAAVPRTNIGNKELTWEEQQTLDFGLEFSMFDGRLRGSMDYFVNTRSDFLFENPLPYEGGSYTQYTNAGKMQTNGFEFEISGDVVKAGDFKWNLGLNMAFLKYEIKELNGQPQIIIGNNILKEGKTPFTYYLPRYAGVDPKNGDALYYDKEGNITNKFSSGDAVILEGKSTMPKMYGGLRSSFSYKGIDLTADFSFKEGNYVYNYMAKNMLSDGDNAETNQRTEAFNYWKKPGDTNVLPKPNGNSNHTTDRFLQDGSYIRFRSLTLGYKLPTKIVEKLKLSSIRLYAQAQNLHTWTSFEGDPEVSVGSGESQLGRNQNFIPGAFVLYSYPTTRTIMFGIDVKF